MKSNEVLQKDVQDAIKWEPLLNAAEIGVTVKDGVVTLTGVVDSYMKKLEVESATKKVAGVKVVVEKITIKVCNTCLKTDGEIATEIVNAFLWNWEIPKNKINIKVESGWVTIDGQLEWNSQRDAAQNTISKLLGVNGVTNNITIAAEIKDSVEKLAIERAITRNWSLDDKNIKVNVDGNKVTLIGTVDSWYQKEEAGRIAWNAPGVWVVDNKLVVDYFD